MCVGGGESSSGQPTQLLSHPRAEHRSDQVLQQAHEQDLDGLRSELAASKQGAHDALLQAQDTVGRAKLCVDERPRARTTLL